MRDDSGHSELSNGGWIRLHASVSEETKTIHQIISRNSTLSIPIKVYLWSSLSSLSNEAFLTAWILHWTTGSPVKSIILSWNSPGIYDMSNLLCFV